jgi:hypothetical protein
MRLDSRAGERGWHCYDAKRCCMVHQVVWVEEETATWGRLVSVPYPPFLTDKVIREERITIHHSRRLVVFNEIEDSSEDEIMREIEVAA